MPKARSGTIYFQHKNSSACTGRYHRRCTGRWRGEITVDGGRRKVSGSSRQEVADKLDKLRAELAKGIRPRAGYTVEQCIRDYLDQALPGRAPKTVSTYRECLDPLLPILGGKRLTELGSDDVRAALASIGRTRSSRSVQIGLQQLVRAIRHAESQDLIGRNVAELVKATPGTAEGRPSKSSTVAQARQLLTAARDSRRRAAFPYPLTGRLQSLGPIVHTGPGSGRFFRPSRCRGRRRTLPSRGPAVCTLTSRCRRVPRSTSRAGLPGRRG